MQKTAKTVIKICLEGTIEKVLKIEFIKDTPLPLFCRGEKK